MTYARQETIAVRAALECLAWSLFDQGAIDYRLELENANESRRRDFLIRRDQSLTGSCLQAVEDAGMIVGTASQLSKFLVSVDDLW